MNPSYRAGTIERDLCVGHVARLRGVADSEILGRSRRAEIARARHMAVYLFCVGLGRPQSEASKQFNLDRASVRHALATIEDLMDDPPWEGWLAKAVGELTGGRGASTIAAPATTESPE